MRCVVAYIFVAAVEAGVPRARRCGLAVLDRTGDRRRRRALARPRNKSTDKGAVASCVHCGTARHAQVSHTLSMQLEYTKLAVAAGWMSAVCAAGIAGGLDSLASWTVLAAVAVVPSVVMLWHWHHPGQTLSESIQEARR
jgi:hypothetical protein